MLTCRVGAMLAQPLRAVEPRRSGLELAQDPGTSRPLTKQVALTRTATGPSAAAHPSRLFLLLGVPERYGPAASNRRQWDPLMRSLSLLATGRE